MERKSDGTLPSYMDAFDLSADHTHQKLLNRVKNPKDKKAWEVFFHRYFKMIRSMTKTYAGSHGLRMEPRDIEDIAIQVIAEVSQQMPEFEYKPGKRAFRSYLATIAHRRCVDAHRKKEARPGHDPLKVLPFERKVADKTGNLPFSHVEREAEQRDDETVRNEPNKDLKAAQYKSNKDKAQQIIYNELFAEKSHEITKLIEEHDMEMGRTLALEKLRANTENVSAQQFQIYEKLVMGVPVANICSQLRVTANQVYIVRNRVMPFYEKALHEAKQELDSPTELPPPLD